MQGPQVQGVGPQAVHLQPVIVSAIAGDPSADWDLIDIDEEEEEDVKGEENNKAFLEGAENRLIGKGLFTNDVTQI